MADYEYLLFGKKLHKVLDWTDAGAGGNTYEIPSDVPVEASDSVSLRIKDPYLTNPDNAAYVDITVTAVLDTGEGQRIQYNREAGAESYRPNDFGAAHPLHNKTCPDSTVCIDFPTQNDLNSSTVQANANGDGLADVGATVDQNGLTQAQLEAALLTQAQTAFASAYISEGTGTGGANQLCIPVYDSVFTTSFTAQITTAAT